MNLSGLFIGNELLNGKAANTNAVYLGKAAALTGQELHAVHMVKDNPTAIAEFLKELEKPGGVVVVSGGLGPTADDLTREALSIFAGRPLVYDEGAAAWLASYLKKRGRGMSAAQRSQAMVIQGSEPLRNPLGTACGMRVKTGGLEVLALPGVPVEFQYMVDHYLLPLLKKTGRKVWVKGLWTFGWPEADQAEALRDLAIPSGMEFSSLPNWQGVRLELRVQGGSPKLQKQGEAVWRVLRSRIPKECIVDGRGRSLVQYLMHELGRTRATTATAESCTGGLIASLLTSLPGSSAVFTHGFVTYSNASKQKLLGVPKKVIENFGAVSRECVEAMLRGCLKASGAKYAIAVSGIAGPGGGTADKPVGTVWIAVGGLRRLESHRLSLGGTREVIRQRAAYCTLNFFRLFLKNEKNALHK